MTFGMMKYLKNHMESDPNAVSAYEESNMLCLLILLLVVWVWVLKMRIYSLPFWSYQLHKKGPLCFTMEGFSILQSHSGREGGGGRREGGRTSLLCTFWSVQHQSSTSLENRPWWWWMGRVRKCRNPFVDRAGWQAKMASIELWIPWRNAHTPHSVSYIWTPFLNFSQSIRSWDANWIWSTCLSWTALRWLWKQEGGNFCPFWSKVDHDGHSFTGLLRQSVARGSMGF